MWEVGPLRCGAARGGVAGFEALCAHTPGGGTAGGASAERSERALLDRRRDGSLTAQSAISPLVAQQSTHPARIASHFHPRLHESHQLPLLPQQLLGHLLQLHVLRVDDAGVRAELAGLPVNEGVALGDALVHVA